MKTTCTLTLLVLAAVTLVSSQDCPPGVPVAMCARNPCFGAVCRAVPEAICKVSFCGGCFAHFFINDDVRVDCDPYRPRIENVHFRTQNEEGVIEGDNMKMIIHHKGD